MSFLDGLLHRACVLARGDRYDNEVRAEMQFHLELETQALSHDSTTAENEARRAFGNKTYYREEVRRLTALGWVDRVRQDLSYAWRGLRREPAFTAAVVVTLALGLGVNTAVYSVLDRIFVRAPAGVPAPATVRRLYMIGPVPINPGRDYAAPVLSYPDYSAILSATGATLGAFTESDSVKLLTGSEASTARLSYANASYFRVLGLRPLAGRFFSRDEDRVQTPAPVIVISDDLWARLFNRSPAALGHPIDVNGSRLTIIGIAPPEFTGTELDRADLWTPLGNFVFDGEPGRAWYEGSGNFLHVLAAANSPADVAALAERGTAALRAEYSTMLGRRDTLSRVLVAPLIAALGPARPDVSTTISTRLAAVAIIVLLTACANVVNLLLLRASRRQREIAVRRALGVSASRLLSQLITESTLLALIAGVAALLVGAWGGSVLRHVLFPRVSWAGGTLTRDVVVICAMGALLVGVLAGLAPALSAMRVDAFRGLRDGAQSGNRGSAAVRACLLIAQAALSVVLLVGAGLFVRSLQKVDSIDLGYAADQLLFAKPEYSSGARSDTVISQALPSIAAQLSRAPGVRSVALADMLPMRGIRFGAVYLPGRDSVFRPGPLSPTYVAVSPNYFSTVGIKLLAGRAFSSADTHAGQPVVIVSQSFARAAWPGESPLGKCVALMKRTNPCTRVVGMVADAHRMDVVEDQSYLYWLPLAQAAAPPGAIVIRADPAYLGLLTGIARRAMIRALPRADAPYVKSMAATLEPQTRSWRLGAELFTVFGALAVVIAAIGIYTVVAYGVAQRMHELGVRIALGARASNIVSMVVGGGLRLVVVGIAFGVGAALLLARAIQSLLYGVTPSDPITLVFAGGLLVAFGAIACLLPAWRAARVDPVVTLRAE